MRFRNAVRIFLALALLASAVAGVRADHTDMAAAIERPKPPSSLRLYVFDCGTLHPADMGRYQLSKEEVATTDLSDACFLIAHPKGTLIWDTGAVADTAWKPNRNLPVNVHIALPDGQEREATMRRGLIPQLAEAGYKPGMIDYLVLSHYHYDHTGNANQFTTATWLVRQVERDAMFAGKLTATTDPATYSKLRDAKTKIIATDDYDVFGDGTVIIKFAPGHTPGHQVLYLKLAHTGPVLLSGDLYHYPEERALGRVPKFDFDPQQTRASRAKIEAFLKQSGAQLWIQHDFVGNSKLKKSPAYYD